MTKLTNNTMSKRRPTEKEAPNRLRDLDRLHEEGRTLDAVIEGEMTVPVQKILVDPQNERKTFDEESIGEMADSIRQHGVLENPIVTQVDDGYFMLLAGHRRLAGAKRAGKSEIKVTVRPPESPGKRRLLSIISNVQRENIRPVEMAVGLKYLLDNDPEVTTQDALAERLGKRKVWVSEMLRILDMPKPLQERVRTSELATDTLTKIARETDPAFQEELVEAAISGATVRDIRERINERKGKPVRRSTSAVGDPSNGEENGPLAKKNKLPKYRDAYVVIQPTTDEPLTVERQIDILREGIKFLEKRRREQEKGARDSSRMSSSSAR